MSPILEASGSHYRQKKILQIKYYCEPEVAKHCRARYLKLICDLNISIYVYKYV